MTREKEPKTVKVSERENRGKAHGVRKTFKALQEEEAMFKKLSTMTEAGQLAVLRGYYRLRASGETGEVSAVIWMIGICVAIAAVVIIVTAVVNSKADILKTL